MITVDNSTVTTTLLAEKSDNRPTDIYSIPQGLAAIELAGMSQAFPKLANGKARCFCFSNRSKTDIEINYLSFENNIGTGLDVWHYANVLAGSDLPISMRAIKTVTGTTFVAGMTMQI